MRILFKFFILVVLLHSSSNLWSQFTNDTIKNLYSKPGIILKTNPLSMLQGPIIFCSEFRVAGEFMMSKKQSLQITGAYLGKGAYLYLVESSQNSSYKFKVNGVRFCIEYRLFAFNNKEKEMKPEGPYLAPAFSYSSLKITDAYSNAFNEYISATYINYTLKFGYQFINNNFALDLFGGMGYKDNTWAEQQNQSFSVLKNEDFELFPGNIKIVLGFNVGIAF